MDYSIRKDIPKNCVCCKFNETCISHYGGLGCTYHIEIIKEAQKRKQEENKCEA